MSDLENLKNDDQLLTMMEEMQDQIGGFAESTSKRKSRRT